MIPGALEAPDEGGLIEAFVPGRDSIIHLAAEHAMVLLSPGMRG